MLMIASRQDVYLSDILGCFIILCLEVQAGYFWSNSTLILSRGLRILTYHGLLLFIHLRCGEMSICQRRVPLLKYGTLLHDKVTMDLFMPTFDDNIFDSASTFPPNVTYNRPK